LNNGRERDHQHLKQRLCPMRGFKHLDFANMLARGHALIQNLRTGFSTLTATVPQYLRVAAAWSRLVLAISPAPVLLRAR
jgi:transposase-like protein